MKKFNSKAAWIFAIPMSVVFIIQNLWTTEAYTTEFLIRAIIGGIIPGILSGFLFGLLTGWFASSKVVNMSTKIELLTEEEMQFQTGANHFMGLEGVGGKLYLTNQRLVFKSHKLNFQKHELSILLSDISTVERYKTIGIIDNGLTVTVGGKEEKFVVESPEIWLEKLS